jgi:spore maturation protein CgeB
MSKAKRIFIVADIVYNPAKMYLNAMRKLAKGWIRLGHDVEIFSYRSAIFNLSPIKSKKFAYRFYKSQVDELLASRLKHYIPDIVFIGFPRIFDSKSVEFIRQAVPGAVLIGYEVDPWPKLQKNRIETAKKFDIVVATNDGEFLQDYRDGGVPHCFFMPNVCDPDTDHRYEVGSEWKTDILWTGTVKHRADTSESLREKLVTELAKQDNCKLYGCLGRPKVGGIEYLYAISGACIGAHINAVNSVRMYHSDRLTQYLSGGIFGLAKRVPDTNLLFQDGEHLKYFDTVDEFFNMAEWYLGHEAERKRIANAGMQWTHERFNCVKIAGYILELVEKGTYSAPWIAGT